MCLKHKDASSARKYFHHPCLRTQLRRAANDVRPPRRPVALPKPTRQVIPPLRGRTVSSPPVSASDGPPCAQDALLPSSSSALLPSTATTFSGPGGVIKPRSYQDIEDQRHNSTDLRDSFSWRVEAGGQAAAGMRPHGRIIAHREIEELRSTVHGLFENKMDPNESESLSDHCSVLEPNVMNGLCDKMAKLIDLGCFDALPVEMVMKVQSLLLPAITSTILNALSNQSGESSRWANSISSARYALQAAQMILNTMIEGRDDFRTRREDVINVIVDLIKFIKNGYIDSVKQARRTGSIENPFAAATGRSATLRTVLRLCGSVLNRFAALIGKFNLSERALNTMECLMLELAMKRDCDSERDSIFGIQEFEQLRQQAMDLLTQIFARHTDQRGSILNSILSNLEKLPDKKAKAQNYRVTQEVPIMTISATFMRFVQISATHKDSPIWNATGDDSRNKPGYDVGDHEPDTENNMIAARVTLGLADKASLVAGNIATSLVDRAMESLTTGDKSIRDLLNLFIEDLCSVMDSPEWPAAHLLLQHLTVSVLRFVEGEQAAKQKVVDKDMALSTMTRIGSGIIDFKHRLRDLRRKTLDVVGSDLSSKLACLVHEATSGDTQDRVDDQDLLAFDGPYRMVLESLTSYSKFFSHLTDSHLNSISGFHVTSWMAAYIRAFPDTEIHAQAQPDKELSGRLVDFVMKTEWTHRNGSVFLPLVGILR
jgi:cohesin loading factor subunit SCC2